MEFAPSYRNSLQADIQPSFRDTIMHEKDLKYGLPRFKKYPMPDISHVKSAIKFFNYVTSANEEELARAILARMDEYGMSSDSINVGDNNRFKKYLDQAELKHFGIKGMHWGVRRYQNEDGTLTAAGHERYLNSLDKRMRNDTINYANNNYRAQLYNKKADDFSSRGKDKKASKYKQRAIQAEKYRDAYNDDFTKASNALIDDLRIINSSGYSWKSTPMNYATSHTTKQTRALGKELVSKYGRQKIIKPSISNAGTGNKFRVKETSKLSTKKQEQWKKQHTARRYSPQQVIVYY